MSWIEEKGKEIELAYRYARTDSFVWNMIQTLEVSIRDVIEREMIPVYLDDQILLRPYNIVPFNHRFWLVMKREFPNMTEKAVASSSTNCAMI